MANFLDDPFPASGSPQLVGTTAPTGGLWSLPTGYADGLQIFGGLAFRSAGNGFVGAINAATPPSADYQVQAKAYIDTASSASAAWYVHARADASGYGYFAGWDGSSLFLGKRGAGGDTILSSPGAVVANGDTYGVRCVGTTISLLKNGSVLSSVTDSTYSSAGSVAVSVYWVSGGNGYFAFDSVAAGPATGPLSAPAAVLTALASGRVTVGASAAASGGTGPFDFQLTRGTDGTTFGTSVGSAQTGLSGAPTAVADTGRTDGALYYYRWSVTDSVPATATGAAVKAVSHAAGTVFYVSTAGSDSANGSTTGTAWQTVARVNALLEASALPGDSVLFRSGDTFPGSVRVRKGGAAVTPLVLGKYGTGVNPVVSCGDSYGVWIDDCSNVQILDLAITGSGVSSSGGVTTSTDSGVKVTLAGSADLYGVVVRRCQISGCVQGIGGTAAAGNPHSVVGLAAVGNRIYQCGTFGVSLGVEPVGSAHTLRFTDPLFTGNTIEDVYGVNAIPFGSGYGMYFGNCLRGLVQGNLVRRCGHEADNGSHGGPVGLGCFETDGMVFSGNEVHHQYAPEGIDGQGIDLDGGARNCVVERNWVHDCDGPAFMDLDLGGFTANAGNTFRFNVTQNNGRRSSGDVPENDCTFAALHAAGTRVHNNTDYSAKVAGSEPGTIDASDSVGAVLRNNVFVVSGAGMTFGNVPAGTILQGNVYNPLNGATFSLTYDGVEKTSLAALRAVAETVGGVATGSTADAGLANPGGGGSDYPVGEVARRLTAYDPAAPGSPPPGVDLLGALGFNPGPADFHGNLPGPSAGAATAAAAAGGGGGDWSDAFPPGRHPDAQTRAILAALAGEEFAPNVRLTSRTKAVVLAING